MTKKLDKPFTFTASCATAREEDIGEMINGARRITYRTIARYCDLSIFPSCPHIGKDYAVGFYKSKYKGKPCYYVCHSAIEYVFTRI